MEIFWNELLKLELKWLVVFLVLRIQWIGRLVRTLMLKEHLGFDLGDLDVKGSNFKLALLLLLSGNRREPIQQ